MSVALHRPTAISALRDSCKNLHEALHVHPLLRPLTKPDITFEDYAWIIRAFHRAYSIMETKKKTALNDGLPDSPVLEWLAADMAMHGIEPLPLPDLPYEDIENLPQLAGYLYVKQGSTLGGQIISPHLDRHLGLKAGASNHFFAGYGADTGAMWKEFTTKANNLLTESDINTAIVSAQNSFRLLASCCDAAYSRRCNVTV